MPNVWEWCQDWYGSYTTVDVTDPVGPSKATVRVLRGGSWRLHSEGCRAADRGRFLPQRRRNFLGFRVAAVPAG
jgi:formylglycine-generating enzyme required for sulfatase activity